MNENDENGVAPARLTRSKAASNENDVDVPAKKALQTKKSAVNTQPPRKRAALGDVSNVTKAEITEGKKPTVKGGLVSKAAQPTGIQKNVSRTNSSRSIASTKEPAKKVELKRSGSGVMAPGKRKTSSTSSNTMSIKEETPVEDEQPSERRSTLNLGTKPTSTTIARTTQTKRSRPKSKLSPRLWPRLQFWNPTVTWMVKIWMTRSWLLSMLSKSSNT